MTIWFKIAIKLKRTNKLQTPMHNCRYHNIFNIPKVAADRLFEK